MPTLKFWYRIHSHSENAKTVQKARRAEGHSPQHTKYQDLLPPRAAGTQSATQCVSGRFALALLHKSASAIYLEVAPGAFAQAATQLCTTQLVCIGCDG